MLVHKLDIKQSQEYIIGKKEVGHFSKIYDETGYEQPLVVEKESEEAKNLYKSGKYLWIGNSLSDWPFTIPRGKTYVVKNFSPNKKKMYELASVGFITSTDLADYIVMNYELPFRKAYQITSKIVNYAEVKNIKLNELTLKELKKNEPKLNEDILKVFDLKNSIKSKKSYGGTSFENVKKMIRKYKKESK